MGLDHAYPCLHNLGEVEDDNLEDDCHDDHLLDVNMEDRNI